VQATQRRAYKGKRTVSAEIRVHRDGTCDVRVEITFTKPRGGTDREVWTFHNVAPSGHYFW
jgi:hypothetical protein